MPILGLTDRGAAFPRLGILRKGAAKPNDKQPSADLKDHFRFECDDASVVADFRAAYGDRPNHIRVMFYYRTAAENFETWQEHHSAGALKHRCDGQTCVLTLQTDGTYSHEPQPCPSIALKAQNPTIDKKHLCRPVGRLKVVIPELRRMAYILVPTTSINDILELQANLEAAEALRGDLRGIPFVLSRRPRKVSTPSENGARARREKWLLSIEPSPDWVRLQLTAMEHAALPGQTQLALPAPSNGTSYIDQDTGEIFDADEDEPVAAAPEQPIGVDLETIVGTVSRVHSWYTEDGAPRLNLWIGDVRAIVAGDVAETWFDIEEGEALEIGGSWAVHPKVGRYFAVATIQRAVVSVEQPEAVAA